MRIYPINMVGPDKQTAEKRILLLIIADALELLLFFNTVHSNSTIYSNIRLNGEEIFSKSLNINR